jgi:hypothetical protein
LAGLIERVMSPIARLLPTQDNTKTEQTQTSMPRVGFNPMISVSEGAKIFQVLDSAATVIGSFNLYLKISVAPGQYRIIEPLYGRHLNFLQYNDSYIPAALIFTNFSYLRQTLFMFSV